jgi:hypothetical protein
MMLILKEYDKKLRFITVMEWFVTLLISLKNIFFPTMVVACEIAKGSEMVQANPRLKLAGVKRFTIEMSFSERDDRGLAPPVMKVKVPPKYLNIAQGLF